MDIQVKDILNTCEAELIFGNPEEVCGNFSKDTRTIQENDTYVGIKGENFDGNTLFEQAFQKGAKICIVQNIEQNSETKKQLKEKYKDKTLIQVKDTIKALQQIAKYKRELYNIPVIAVTGSVGKTSTKDIISSVVGTTYKVLKTQGNLNNHIGLPMTILGLKNHEAMVVEMGMNNLGEISVLSKIAKPNIAVITNVGTSHIGNLGSRENILKAKLEILDGLAEDGILIINNDNDLLNKWYKNYKGNLKILTYGIENESEITASNIISNEYSSEFIANIKPLEYTTYDITKNDEQNPKITVPVAGLHFVYNALCATLVGKVLNIPIENIKQGIEKFELTKNRMEIINLPNNILVVNDCYNANYDSMKAGIEYIAKTKADRKIAVLGDMLELGKFSYELHKKVGEEIIKNKIDILITVGEMAKVIAETVKTENENIYICNNNEEATIKLKEIMKANDIILVKASNGMKFKEIVENIKQ